MWKNKYYLNNNIFKITDRQSGKKMALTLFFLMTIVLWEKNPTIIAPSTVTMQKLERQAKQKSKEPGVNEERTQVLGESHCGGGNFGPGPGNNFPQEEVMDMEVGMDLVMATMGMVESLEVATLEVALIIEENIVVEAQVWQPGVGWWR